jgi:hypothetical protein
MNCDRHRPVPRCRSLLFVYLGQRLRPQYPKYRTVAAENSSPMGQVPTLSKPKRAERQSGAMNQKLTTARSPPVNAVHYQGYAQSSFSARGVGAVNQVVDDRTGPE